FNDSTGQGDMGEIDTKGPWNEGETWQVVDAPAFKEARGMNGEAEIRSEASQASDADAIRELLIDQMRDLLHAEKQLVKALPKMAKAAQSEQLVRLIEHHLTETETQVERLTEGLKMLDAVARAKPCKGMMGLLEEGDEVMREGKKMEPAGADLALIGSAQKVEHYEMAGYITARNLAQQLQMPGLVQLLQLSLAEEENADQLLNQLARPLMSAARMPEPVA
ncbi:MAG TPA: ferritin-like domain-containing protein, partial [Hyphomicrobiaceae bacterium]|nr:ferritin-like domain-containing protein [Hyphomicrobiaceae bacterium]